MIVFVLTHLLEAEDKNWIRTVKIMKEFFE